jgi:hypothetical protein
MPRVLRRNKRRSNTQRSHVLLQKRGHLGVIRAAAPTVKGVAKKAQPIINTAGPKARFRFATLIIRRDQPAFRKGE